MKLNLKKLSRQLPPWDFAVEIDDVAYPTRPLTDADLRFIAAMQGGQVQEVSRVMSFLDSLFPKAKPDLAAFEAEVLTLLLAEMVAYGKNRADQCLQDKIAAPPTIHGPLN